MRLPADAVIVKEKLTRYLLLPHARGDKSAFLAQAGYVLENADQLLTDLRNQILPFEAEAGIQVVWAVLSSTRDAVRTEPRGFADSQPFG